MSKYPGRVITDLAPAGYSVFFDGTGDYLQVADNAVFDLDTGDFTVEAWWYPTTISSTYQTIAGLWNSPGSNFGWILQARSTDVLFSIGTGFFTVLGSTTITANRWYHVAATRSGTTIRVFLNGSLLNSGTSAASGTAVANLQIGRNEDGNQQYVNGYLSNVRIIKGTAVYTAAFTPPTQLFNITNTSLLTCNSPAIIDQSNNAFAITTNGDARVSTLTPFTAYVPYDPSMGAATPGIWTVDEAMQAAGTRQWNMYDPYFNLTTLLLHGNGTNAAQNNTFLDSSTNNFSITRNGNTTQGSFSPFSQTGWSNFFDGTGDYLSLTISSTTIGSGDFTIEFWYYPTAFQNFDTMFSTTRGANGFNIGTNASASVVWYSSSAEQINSGTLTQNAWNHIAFTRTSNTLRLYVNGSQTGATPTVSTNFSATSCWIGDLATSGSEPSQGYISNLRVVTQSLASGSTYTVSTTPLTAIANTSLLTCQSNRFVDNSTNNFTITRNGDTSIQTFSPFLPTVAYTPQTIGGSGFFDGTGDYLSSATSTDLQLGSSDFSLEWWEYRTAANNVDTAIVCGDGTFSALLGYYNSGAVRFYLSTTGSSWNVFSDTSAGTTASNSWNHFVLTRSGTAFRVFLNGVLGAYATGSGSVTQTTNQIFISGGINGSSAPIEGYMSGVRFVKGSIPTTYQTSSTTTGTSIFTSPTAPVTTTSQGATSGDVKYLVNFTNAGVVDSTADNVLETVGNAQISTAVSRFGGSSIAFDGTGDVLVAPNSANWDMGSGNYTIEFWVYMNTLTGNQTFIARANTASIYATFDIGWYSSVLRLYVSNNGSTYAVSLASSISPAATTWTHIAVTRNGSTYTIWVNGVSGGTATDSGSAVANGNNLGIGGYANAANSLNGYIDDLRITKGIARYTGNFTPQTSQWQDQ